MRPNFDDSGVLRALGALDAFTVRRFPRTLSTYRGSQSSSGLLLLWLYGFTRSWLDWNLAFPKICFCSLIVQQNLWRILGYSVSNLDLWMLSTQDSWRTLFQVCLQASIPESAAFFTQKSLVLKCQWTQTLMGRHFGLHWRFNEGPSGVFDPAQWPVLWIWISGATDDVEIWYTKLLGDPVIEDIRMLSVNLIRQWKSWWQSPNQSVPVPKRKKLSSR